MEAAFNVLELNLAKLNLFKTQDPQIGRFNMTFEIDGKLLYAHKCMLNLVSETFDSMLSERWTSKNDSVKIENYSFDDFYQFLTFLYSGKCILSIENISSMVDIAEFYQVQCFKDYCDEFLSEVDFTEQNVSSFFELATKYSLVKLKIAVYPFVANNFSTFSATDDFLKLDKSNLEEIVTICKNEKVKQEDVFQAVFKWAEFRAKDKQEDDLSTNVNDEIKSLITEFLPHIDFTQMKLSFLLEFVVPRGFIFDSFDELSKILSGASPKNKVIVTNYRRQKLSGKISPDDKTLIERIQSFKVSTHGGTLNSCWWLPKADFPSKPCSLKKRSGVDWYLIYFPGGHIGLKRASRVKDSYYLIAEMFPEPGKEFIVTPNCKIQVICDF